MSSTEKATEILREVRFASMATVNADGSPHNSPLVLLYDDDFTFLYWGSHPESLHSQNVMRAGEVFFAIFNSLTGGVGIYVEGVEADMVPEEELETALGVHNRFRRKWGKHEIELDYYQGDSPQRMWRAKVSRVWINGYDRDGEGKLREDYKIEVDTEGLKGVWG